MKENRFSDEKMEGLWKLAGKKMGLSSEELKQRLDNGDFSGFGNADFEKFKQFFSDPEACKKLMNSPAAQALLKRFQG